MELPEDLIAEAMEEAEQDTREGRPVDLERHRSRLLKLGAHEDVVDRHLVELKALRRN